MRSHEQIFLFMGHRATSSARRSFLRLETAVAPLGDLCWLYDASAGPVPPFVRSRRHHPFTCGQFADLHYTQMHPAVVPGQGHFPLLLFFRDHPDYRHYWVIEYDVRYAGDWGAFFRECADDPADLLTCHIRRHAEEPGWPWWDLHHPVREIPLAARVRSFNPIYRLSRAALTFLDAELRDGWCGHYEVLVPALLQHGGFRLADIGGSGAFTPPARKNRLYVDGPPNPAGLLQAGTMRYRPPFWRAGTDDGLLYHPVKPLLTVLRERGRQARRDIRCAFRSDAATDT